MQSVAKIGGWPLLLGKVTGGSSLSRDEAAAALADILAGAATPAQVAGLIVGLRMKGESVEEITGLASAMMAAAEPLTLPAGTIDIVGTGGSAHRQTHALNISTMASIVAAAAGAVVCKHGNRRASSTSGSFDFLEALGVGVELTPAELEACVSKIGLGFAFARTFHPAMRHVGPVRAELGIPTVFNVLGPLAHPGRLRRQVVGTATPELASTMAQVLQNLGSERAWVVVGDGGIDELSTTGPTEVFEVTPDVIDRRLVTPREAGVSTIGSLDEVSGGSPADNAAIFRAIADGSDHGPRRDVVVLNAAAGLVVAGLASDLGEGVIAAGRAIDDGRVGAKIDDLVAAAGPTT
jgi:anthranilate phosphoribosyltransferase